MNWKTLTVACLVLFGIALTAAITASAFGGDLSTYQAAPTCTAGQNSSNTECKQMLSTTSNSTSQGSPCRATFAGTDATANMDCGSVWHALRAGVSAQLVLWHGEVVTVADSAGTAQTDAFPEGSGGEFLVIALACAVAGVLVGGGAAVRYRSTRLTPA